MKIRELFLSFSLIGSILSTGCTGTGSPPKEFKCNRDDVVMAAIKDIRHRASGYTYSDYIYAPAKLDNKPFAAYSDKQDSIPIALEEIETISIKKMSDGSGRNALICNAKLRIEIPAAVANIMKLNQHQKMRVLDNAKGKFGDRSVHFDNVEFRAHEIDGGSITADVSNYNGPWSLHVITTLAVNGRHLMLEDALRQYRTQDANLNLIWENLPKYRQATERDSQRSWIKSKTDKCGEINLEPYDSEDIFDRIDIIECHAKMTKSRVFEMRR